MIEYVFISGENAFDHKEGEHFTYWESIRGWEITPHNYVRLVSYLLFVNMHNYLPLSISVTSIIFCTFLFCCSYLYLQCFIIHDILAPVKYNWQWWPDRLVSSFKKEEPLYKHTVAFVTTEMCVVIRWPRLIMEWCILSEAGTCGYTDTMVKCGFTLMSTQIREFINLNLILCHCR